MQTSASPTTGRTWKHVLQAGLVGLVTTATVAQASTDYGPATWRPACHYNSSGYGKRFYVIHDIEGYYWGCISYFQRCSTQASVHYTTNGKKDTSSDSAPGAVTQMVRDSYYAWHARCWNGYSLGTEHEGFVSNPAWFTEAQYVASASITKSKATKYGFAKDRNHVIGHDQKRIAAWRSWMSASGYGSSFYNCNDHSDPGSHWNWTHYMDLVRGTTVSTPSAPSTLTASVYSSTRLDLKWKDNSGIETGFKVERSTSATSGFAQIGTTAANDVTYSASGLATGTKYYFRVRAYNAGGNSGYSGTASATTKDTIPAAVTALTATAVSDVQINLAWAQAMPNEDGFRIYRSTDGTNFAQVATAAINATSYANTGLTGNRKYYYRVYAYNTAGNSAASGIASDTTAPQAPSALTVTAVAGTTNWNKLNLAWTDNANAEVGFKVERGTAAAGPFTQIGTTPASDNTYEDSGLAASTTYYYRVRSYNANGNSAYSAVVSKATGNAPPVLGAIGNKTVAAGSALAFTATSSDPNAPAATSTVFATWEGNAHGDDEIVFRRPINSGTTSTFIDTAATNYTFVATGAPAGVSGTKALKSGWSFKTGTANYWIRYTTAASPSFPNPTIQLDQTVRFKIYSSKALKVGVGIRETGTTAAYGANGGTTGDIEWAAVTNVVSGAPIASKAVAANTWTTLSFNLPFEPQAAFTGDGKIVETGAKGVLEHLVIKGDGGTGAYTMWIDDLAVVTSNYRTFSLDAGAPAGAAIARRSGKFTWTPTTGQVGAYNITVRVTDNLGAQDFETIKVTVTGTGNSAPVLSAIGSKTVKEGTALAFTAAATDANGNALTFSLDAGNPSGSAITTGGAFSWTPTEAQGPGTYPITVRVTDNGVPSSNDFEVVSVAVSEVNVAPALAAIANQTINEGQTLALTASATDSDVPANTITYSVAGPAGMTINASSGALSWTPGTSDGGDVAQVTVTAKDNGNPALSTTRTFLVTVNDQNTAPVLSLGTLTDYSPIAGFDELDDENLDYHNNTVLFRVPYFSASTTSYLDSTSYTFATNEFPRDEVVNNSYQALFVQANFKTGTTAPWVRLTTYTSGLWTNTFAYPNPTINLGQKVRFKIWSDKSIKVALGVRETGTGNPLGLNGGITGPIEWVGATTVTNAGVVSPVPTRVINASNWTQVEFNLPTETVRAFPGSGNGVLAAGKGVLEHLAITPNGGTGIYQMYVDDFEAVLNTTGSTVTIDTGDTLTFTASATDTDLPAQDLEYTLTGASPTNATITKSGGVFSWTPDPTTASTNVISVTVTDSGTPALSDTENLTVIVNKVNTPPHLDQMDDQVVETSGGGTVVTFDASGADEDGDTLTYSITSGPGGATINGSTGAFSWTTPAGVSTNVFTIRVTDSGSPALWDEQSVNIVVVPANTAPTLNLGVARATESVFTFETFTNNTPNEAVLFKKPGNSATTTNYVDLAVTNYSSVTTSFPAGNAAAGAKVLKVGWSFKTGTSNYWVRLTSGNTTFLPNPTINASARVKFDIYTDKALKVGLGIRETGTAVENGANGGTTGTIEYVGVSSQIGTTPVPTRTVNAGTWTTLEFDLPSEPVQALTGNGVLSGGQQVIEHLILKGEGGTGAYTVYVDNFSVVTTTALPGAVSIKAGSTLTFTAGGTDPDPGAGLTYGLDADFADTYPTAVLNETSGAFTWTPAAAGSVAFDVSVEDAPTNGGLSKSATGTVSTTIVSDTLAPQ